MRLTKLLPFSQFVFIGVHSWFSFWIISERDEMRAAEAVYPEKFFRKFIGASGKSFPEIMPHLTRQNISPRENALSARVGTGAAKESALRRTFPKKNVERPLVSFPIREIYLPQAQEVLLELHGNDLLQGRIIDYSDGGARDRTYAVIHVEGLAHPVIVPVETLRNDCE